MKSLKSLYRVIRSILFATILAVVGLYVLIYVAISLPPVQNQIRKTAQSELSKLLGTEVSIGSVYLSPSGEVRLTDVNVPTPDGGKCLFVKRLGAGIDLGKLIFDHKICFNYAEIVGLDGALSQKEEKGPWNIQFIIDAFKPKDPNKPPTKFDIKLRNVVIRRADISVDRLWKPCLADGRIDFNHLKIENLRMDVTMPRLKNDDFSIDLRRLALREKSGLTIDKIACLVHLTPNKLDVVGLTIQLPGTRIDPGEFHLSYNGYGDIVPALKRTHHNIALDNTRITPSDFSAFLPGLADFNSPATLNLKADGDTKSVSIDHLDLRTADNSISLLAKARMSDFSSIEDIQLTVNQFAAKVTREGMSRILSFIPSMPEKTRGMITRLGDFTVSMRGSLQNLRADADATVNTSIGGVEADFMADFSRKGLFAISGHAATPGFNLGTLLDNPKLGNIAVNTDADVTISNGDVNGSADIDLRNIFFNGQNFNNILANVTKDGKQVSGKVSVDDTDLALQADGNATINGKASVIDATVQIGRFSPSRFTAAKALASRSFSGNIDVHVNGLDPNTATGSVALSDFSIHSQGRNPLHIGNIHLAAEAGEARTVTLHSDFIDGIVTGTFDISRLPQTMTAIAAHSVPALMPGYDKAYSTAGQNLDFDITINDDNTLPEYFNLPVRLLTDIRITGAVDGNTETASVNVDIPYLQQGTNKLIRGTYLQARLDGINRTSMLDLGTILPGKNNTDVDVGLSAFGNGDKLRANVNWDLNRPKKYTGDVAMEMSASKGNDNSRSFGLHILPSKFHVADAVWHIGDGNVSFDNGRLSVENVSVWHKDQFVNIHGYASKDPDDTLTVDLSDIDLDYLFETLNINYVTFGGRATGKAVARSLFDLKTMDAHTEGLKVTNLTYNGGRLGDAELSGRWDPQEMKVAIGADITDEGHRSALIDGGVWVKRDSLSFDMNTNKVNIKFLQPFMSAFTSEISGRASGKVKLYGTFKDIDMTGRVFADTLTMKVDYTNVYYSGSDSVIIDPGRIRVPSFRIYDQYGNSGVFSGTLTHDYFHNPAFDFRVDNARNLLCYNTDAKINPDWYGKIYGNGGGTITGYPGYVGIMVDMAVAPKSVFTFVLNDSEAAADYNFLTFSDRRAEEKKRKEEEEKAATDTEPDFVKRFRKKQEEQQQSRPSVFALDIRATVTPQAEMILVMDPVGGDKIRAHGSGAMQIGYSSDSDEMTMYGKYTLSDGMYNFTLQDLILKDFTIRPGSNISFNGDPFKAILDINAIYRVNTNLADLDKSFTTDRDLNRTNVPVDAVLAVKGDLEAPEISFDIELPTLTQDVARKVKSIISTEDMMSRQIIYLLALNRFYTPEYMATSGNRGELTSVASATVTSQISNMLSQLTDKLTIAPSLRSDKGDFSDTEVDVALSSRLLNNRLLLNGNFGYRDKATSNTTFVGDFDIEYLLNRSGNLRLKAYNHYNDQNYYLKSALTTQGIGIIYRKDFDNPFSFLRRRKKRDNTEIPDSVPPQEAVIETKEHQ